MARPSQYTEQFRKDAVALVRSSDSPLRQIACDLGVNHETLCGWVRAEERGEAGGRSAEPELTPSERDELRKLRARVRELELEKDILRKAAQYVPAPSAPDLLGRDFTATAPGQKLVGDITYLPTEEGWLYLATVIDLHTREVIGHAMAEHMRAELARDAIALATGRGLTSENASSDRPVVDLTEQRIKRKPVLGGLINEYELAA